MRIRLKNGEEIDLEVSPLLLEYVEDYEGGIEQLIKDAQGKKDRNGYTSSMRATNQLLYSIIASNYDKQLTYRQAVRLVNLEDVERIIDFITKEVPNIKNEDKKEKTRAHRI